MHKRRNRSLRALLPLGLIAISALLITLTKPASAGETCKVAVLPEYLEIIIYNRYSRLMSYLESKVGVPFELVIPRNFKEHIEMVNNGDVTFSYQNPCVFLKLRSLCQPLVLTEKTKKWGTESRGVIIANKNSGIKNIDDLEGKRISIVSYLRDRKSVV